MGNGWKIQLILSCHGNVSWSWLAEIKSVNNPQTLFSPEVLNASPIKPFAKDDNVMALFLWMPKNVCIKQKCHTYTAHWVSGCVQIQI